MNDRPKIKIIKKDNVPALELQKQKKNRVTPCNAAREVVATVSDWVADLKDRKRAETKTAFELFRASTPHPNET